MSKDAALAEWWDELSPERREEWLALPEGADVPEHLLSQVIRWHTTHEYSPPVALTYWVEQGPSSSDWHVSGSLWDFLDNKR